MLTGLAGLGLFLFGIWLLEQGLNALAGRSFKLFLRRFTDHPLKAIAAGTVATAVLQSSSVVTLLLLALVGAGVLELTHALGVVLGANLGTTLTGWIVALFGFKVDIEAFVMPLIAAGSLLFVFTEGKAERGAAWGRVLLGVGLLFFGLGMVKEAMGGLAGQVDLVQYAKYGALPFAAAGFAFTAVIQSSSATMAITLAALHAGVIELPSAAALVIGADLGTTSTTMIGGIHGTAAKKRVALAHFLFNLLTDLLALAALPYLLMAVVALIGADEPLLGLVGFHSAFNLLGIVIFLPFLGAFARFLERRYTGPDALPPGFEGLADVTRRVPAAGLMNVERAAAALLGEALALNRATLGLDEEEGLRERILGSESPDERYLGFKGLEGTVLGVASELQTARLDDRQAQALALLRAAVRYTGQGAKNLHDVAHNLRAFEASPDEALYARYQGLRTQQAGFYDRLDQLVAGHAEEDPQRAPTEADRGRFEALALLLSENRAWYRQATDAAYAAASPRLADAERVTDLLNVAREVYTSNKRLVLAAKDLRLPAELARAFDDLPDR